MSNEDEIFKKLNPKMKPSKVELTAQSMSLDVLERNVEEDEGIHKKINIFSIIFHIF